MNNLPQSLREQILELSRQQNIAELSPWFSDKLTQEIDAAVFRDEEHVEQLMQKIISDLKDYRDQAGISTVVLGMSGGVDSALTAALFKKAGWRVVGVTMPIMQDPSETERGIEACEALDIEHIHKDLSQAYQRLGADLSDIDNVLDTNQTVIEIPALIRRGNLRARLRMITLYDLAAKNHGLVASTDNFSELGAGFWTLHGDVGDLSPIQSLLKSWEVPLMAKLAGVPEKTWRATPTDGLGISAGDEAQLGATYLEWDLMVCQIMRTVKTGGKLALEHLLDQVKDDPRALTVYNNVVGRMGKSWFKRVNPVNIKHMFEPERYDLLASIDATLFHPKVLRA